MLRTSYFGLRIFYTANSIVAAALTSTPLSLENPAKRGDPLSPAYWPEFGDRAMLWDLPCIISALAQHEHAEYFTFAMCAFGAAAQKWSTVVGVGHLATELQGLDTFLCVHGGSRHRERARGFDSAGRSRSASAATYPPPLNRFLAEAILRAAVQPRFSQLAPRPQAHSHLLPDGRVTSGMQMGPVADAACEEARLRPPPFASTRNQADATDAELRSSQFPYDPSQPMCPSKPHRRRVASKRKRFTRNHPSTGSAACDRPAPPGCAAAQPRGAGLSHAAEPVDG